MSLDNQTFCHTIGEVFESRLGKIQECTPRIGFNLYSTKVANYFKERCVLVGDAAHTVHPLAGLGANIGIADVAALSQLIIHARDQHKDLASRGMLRKYERWRKTENHKLSLALNGIKNLFEAQHRLARNIRSNGMAIINQSSFIKNRVMKHAMGLSGDIPWLVHKSLLKDM